MQNDLISRSAMDVDLQNLVREYNRNCESDKSAGAFEALYHLRLAPAVDAMEFMEAETFLLFSLVTQTIKEMEEQGRDVNYPRKYNTLLEIKRKLKMRVEIWRGKDGK